MLQLCLGYVCICVWDDDGHVIDLVKDQLPELQLSEDERQKNLELLEEAKKVSDRFLQRRGRRSTCSPTESPTGTTETWLLSRLGQCFSTGGHSGPFLNLIDLNKKNSFILKKKKKKKKLYLKKIFIY